MNDRLFVCRDLLDQDTCRRICTAMDTGTAEAAEILHRQIVTDPVTRLASSIEIGQSMLLEVERLFEAQREAIAAFYGCSLAEREGAGFLRYRAGGFYRPHIDCGIVPSWPPAARRRISVVAFLNSASEAPDGSQFSGGTLRLLDEPFYADVVPRQGWLVAFPSHVLHEVTTVHEGTRDTVVDWFYAPEP